MKHLTIVCHRNVFQNGVTFSKMVNHFFCQKAQNFCIFPTMWFFFGSNFTRKLSKYSSNNVRRDFKLPMSASVYKWQHKCLIWKSIFAVNSPLKLFRATIANTDTRSLQSLHTLFDTCLDFMLAKFEATRMVQNELLDKKASF